METNATSGMTGHACMTCGVWIPLGTTHNCLSLGTTNTFSTAEFLNQLTRIADALERLSTAAEKCNES